MKIVVVVSKNLMDLSKIRHAARLSLNDVITSSNHSKAISMMSAGAGDRMFKIIFDFDLYKGADLNAVRNHIESVAMHNHLKGTQYLSFVPHENIDEIQKTFPGIECVARSKFFRDPAKYLE